MATSRRQFLGRSVAGTLSIGLSSGQNILGQHTYPPPVIGSLTSGIPVLGQKTGLVVQAIESYTKGNVGFVRILADDGSEGWGQISVYDADITARILHRKIAPHFLAQDPGDLNSIVDRCI